VAVGDTLGRGGGPQVTLAERWNGVKWSLMATPNPRLHRSSTLTAVSCPSATFCAAVGIYPTKSGAQRLPLFETWNGTKWSIQPPGPGPVDISCTSATDCTGVAGNTGSPPPSGGLVEHWDGTGWSIEPTPKLPTGTEVGLDGISCTSPTACTAVGTSGSVNSYYVNTAAERWNGTSWTIQSTPNTVDGTANVLRAVSCASASLCTAVGYWQHSCDGDFVCQGGLAERWNGITWKIQHISDPELRRQLFNGVSCPTTTACTAVTSSGFGGGFYTTATWGGAGWTT
jgi:hypothetical protein